MSNSVVILYNAFGDGDSNTFFKVESVFTSIDKAVHYVQATIKQNRFVVVGNINVAHPNMNKENDYVFIGNRSEVNPSVYYNNFGGYVIELTTVY